MKKLVRITTYLLDVFKVYKLHIYTKTYTYIGTLVVLLVISFIKIVRVFNEVH